MQALTECLERQGPGPITETAELERLLAAAWDEFAGSDEEAMEGYKLLNRMERVEWRPPRLTFVIERMTSRRFQAGGRFDRSSWALIRAVAYSSARAASRSPGSHRVIGRKKRA